MAFEFKTKPFAHQLAEFEKSRELAARALLWEQGCVDADTEYLSPTGWRRIVDYDGGMVAQVDSLTWEASFVQPIRYVVQDCATFLRLKSSRGIDQMLSGGHRVLHFSRTGIVQEESASDLAAGIGRAIRRLPMRFTMDLKGAGSGLTIEQLRVQVAVMADATFPRLAPKTTRCTMRLKKDRKVRRIRQLLMAANIGWVERFEEKTGFWVFRFNAPLRLKRYPWWDLTNTERQALVEEIPLWDGTAGVRGGGWSFCSRHESDVDFVQFVAAASGLVTSKSRRDGCWYLGTRGSRVHSLSLRKEHLSVVPSADGKSYCFEVPSGALVLRRNQWIFLTGNTGKTKPVIDTGAWLYDVREITGMVVLAPNGVHSNWVHDELPAHLPDSVAERTRIVWWRTSKAGTKAFAAELDAAMKHDGFVIVCMSYDALMTDLGAKFVKKLLEKRRCLVACDESHRCKNPGSKRTKRVLAMGKYAPYRRILTGTLVDDTPFDVDSQIRFVEPSAWYPLGIRDAVSFRTYFGVFAKGQRFLRNDEKTGLPVFQEYETVVSFRNLGDMKEVIGRYGSRLLKSDVLDLPPKVYSKYYFDISPAQRRLYKALSEEYFAQLPSGGTVTAELAITRLLRFQQIVSGYIPADLEENLRPIEEDNPRIRALRDVAKDVTGKFIVSCKYDIDVDTSAAALREDGFEVVVVDGRTGDEERERAKAAFQRGSAQVFVCKPMEGLTLHAADTMIFFNNGFHLRPRLQMEDRAHRIGLDHPVKYIDIVATDTVDDKKIIPSLRNKREWAALVQGDELKEWI